MNWVLLIILLNGNITMQDFNSESACTDALIVIDESVTNLKYITCVLK